MVQNSTVSFLQNGQKWVLTAFPHTEAVSIMEEIFEICLKPNGFTRQGLNPSLLLTQRCV